MRITQDSESVKLESQIQGRWKVGRIRYWRCGTICIIYKTILTISCIILNRDYLSMLYQQVFQQRALSQVCRQSECPSVNSKFCLHNLALECYQWWEPQVLSPNRTFRDRKEMWCQPCCSELLTSLFFLTYWKAAEELFTFDFEVGSQ